MNAAYESDVVDLNLYLSLRWPVNFQDAPLTTSFLLSVYDPYRSVNEPWMMSSDEGVSTQLWSNDTNRGERLYRG